MVVAAPPILFCTTSCEPSRYALYRSLVSVQRRTPPMLAPLKVLTEPVNSTSSLAVAGPSTASCGPVPLATWPAWLLIEKLLLLLASAPHTSPSDAVPHRDWLARWKVSCDRVLPGCGDGTGHRNDAQVMTVRVDG